MPKIILLGKGLMPYAKELRSAGHSCRVFTSSDDLLSSSPEPFLAVIDEAHTGKIRELKAYLRPVPKVVISRDTNNKAISWVREPRAYMLHMPSPSELSTFTAKIISEVSELKEARDITRRLATLKAELNLFEDLHHLMHLSSDIKDILPAIMKQAKRITRSEAWSVHLVNSETTELNCAKTSGRLSKECASTIASVASWCVNNRKPVMIDDISTNSKFGKIAAKSCKNRSVSLVGAHIEGKSGILGCIELLKGRDSFDSEDLDFLIKLAERTAIVIERVSLQQRLEELVVTDDLTNLFNTRHLNRSVETEIYRSRRYGHSVSVIFMDVDHFKDVNDTHGHLAGSKVLVEIAEILIRELRNIDIVARYGGDEFVLVLPQTTLGNAMAIAERIRQTIEKNVFLSSEKLKLRLTASFGVAAYPETAKSKDTLMRIADESMYNVKRHTRNGVYAIIQ
jgi:diguanylate cyclase (GGDEF)-like protein